MIEVNTDHQAEEQMESYKVYNRKSGYHKSDAHHHRHHHIGVKPFGNSGRLEKRKRKVISNILFLLMSIVALIILVSVYWLYTHD